MGEEPDAARVEGGTVKARHESSSELPETAAVEPAASEWPPPEASLSTDQFRQTHRRLEALYALAQEVYRCRSYDDVLSAALEFLDGLLSPERCVLAIQGMTGEMICSRFKGIRDGQALEQLPVSQNLLRKVRTGHLALLSTDAQEDDRLKDFKSVAAMNIRSVMCAPLGTKDVPRGFVYLDSRLESGIFTRQDLLFLTAVCRLVDLTIQSVERLAHEHEQADRREKLLAALRGELFRNCNLVGQSEAILAAYRQLKRVSKTSLPILLAGETGTGKELLARAAHLNSPRGQGPLVTVNLAAANPNLVESELFGHEAGAFTGAVERRVGLLERADGGTLFLDEVSRLPVELQSKLLRAIESREFCRAGGNDQVRSDFRVIVASSQDLGRLASEGHFLPDLYYRLAGATVTVPPLRERPEDIPILVDHFLAEEAMNQTFSPEAIRALQAYSWPGNVRQLRNTVIAMACMNDTGRISAEDCESYFLRSAPGGSAASAGFVPLPELLAGVERRHIIAALDRSSGNNNEAIRLLGIARATFFERKRRYGIK
jgi:DNA-binding NtrC family response regulator